MIADFDLDDFVTRTLAEDMGEGGDVTSAATIPAEARFTATMNCREKIVVAGTGLAACNDPIDRRKFARYAPAVPVQRAVRR